MTQYFIPPEWADWSQSLINWIVDIHRAGLEASLLPEDLHLTARPPEVDDRNTVTSGEITPGTTKVVVGNAKGLFTP